MMITSRGICIDTTSHLCKNVIIARRRGSTPRKSGTVANMIIERIEGDSECTFIILCELVSQNINAITDELNRFAKDDTRDAVIDLASVRKIDSMSIAALIRFKNALSEKNRSLSLINPNETVLRVLELSGLERFLME